MTAADLQPLAVPLVLAGGGLLVLLGDVLRPRGVRYVAAALTLLTLAAALVTSFLVDSSGTMASGVFVGGAWATFLQRALVATALPCVLAGASHVARVARGREGEYHLMLLMSLTGMALVPGAHDLMLLLVSFELMGIPLYVLAAYGEHPTTVGAVAEITRIRRASEAGLKLYLTGALSTAITVFGMSLVAGAAASTRLDEIAAAPNSPVLTAGMLLVLAGMGFKIGAVPFHMWVPDTYQGASTPFVAFLSVAPKAAGLSAIATVLMIALPSHRPSWIPAIAALSALTMLGGNLLALMQTDAKRLLACSGIAQIGTMLLVLAAGNTEAVGTLAFYVAAYAATNVGAFLVQHAVSRAGGGDGIDAFDGLGRRSPWLALAMLMFLLSLGGVPFAIGFWAKLYVFLVAWRAGFEVLVLLGALLAVVGLFYYLRIARAMYMTPPRAEGRVAVEPALVACIVACLLAVIGLGLWPGPLVDAAMRAGVGFFG